MCLRLARRTDKGRNYDLNIVWLNNQSVQDSADLPDPAELIADAITEINLMLIKEKKYADD